jgi:hypothetical protein
MDWRQTHPDSNWLWKKPSLAFFHEGERRKSRVFSTLAAAASSGG